MSVPSKYDLEGGGREIPADRIEFIKTEQPGYYRILVDGEEVTNDNIRGCVFPSCVQKKGLKIGILVRGFGKSRQLAIFHNGEVTKWTSEEEGFPKIEITGSAVKCRVGAQSMDIPLAAVA